MTDIEIDCHTHPFNGEDGYQTLIGIAETYGVLIEDLPSHALASWAWWYRVAGPRAHVRRFLIEQYCGCDEEFADQILGEDT